MTTFKEQGIDSFPLSWPVGWPRTKFKKDSKFGKAGSISFERARKELFHELWLMGVGNWNIILSTNLPLRRDGNPYAQMPNPEDSGVAVYFRLKEKQHVFACDSYKKIADNIWAIRKTIEALRGIERWGASGMLERVFSGFAALPPPTKEQQKDCWGVLGVPKGSPEETVKEAFRKLASIHHPDKGGSTDKMALLNKAYEEALLNQ